MHTSMDTETLIEEKELKAYPIDMDYVEDGFGHEGYVDLNRNKRGGYIKACEEYESLPKIHGWVARDGLERVNELCVYNEKPIRPSEDSLAIWRTTGGGVLRLPKEMFPEIIWESEPVEVELLIRKV